MDMKRTLKNLYYGVIAPSLTELAVRKYNQDVSDGEYSIDETEYAEAMAALPTLLSQQQLKELTKLEKLQANNRAYVTTPGFIAGLLYGFSIYYKSEKSAQYTFDVAIQKGVLEVASAPRHPEYHDTCKQIMDLQKSFEEELSTETNDHTIAVSCTWDQRVYSAVRDSYYMGYLAACFLLDCVEPLASMSMIHNTLRLEYDLGYTEPYYMREAKHRQNEQMS